MAKPVVGRAPLVIDERQRQELLKLAASRKSPLREVKRAKILLAYTEGSTPTQIQRAVGVSRPSIYKCIDKALSAGEGEQRLERPVPLSPRTDHYRRGEGMGRAFGLSEAQRVGVGRGVMDTFGAGWLCIGPCWAGRAWMFKPCGQGYCRVINEMTALLFKR